MITEKEMEDSLHFMRDRSLKMATDRAQRLWIEEFRKTVKAQIMQEHTEKPVSAQEREAYQDPRYIEHLLAIKEAIRIDEHNRFLAKAAETKVEAWRTQQANNRLHP